MSTVNELKLCNMESQRGIPLVTYAHFISLLLLITLEYILMTDITSDSHFGGKFGEDGPIHLIDSVEGFPDVQTFFNDYAVASKPLKMTGAVKSFPAFQKWSDDYFLSLDIPADNLVLVETKKKENRKQNTLQMHFKDFVNSYNTTEQYMVETVPAFLQKDVYIPAPLHCEPILEDLMDGVMWYSSGGTKSVVHTDAVENINCLFSGQKQFVLVNPHLYGDKIDMDHPEGAYSGVDVDRIDYSLYPGLREVEFEVANMTAGDCLYIPFKWIHQVRSYNRNIAINFWFGSKPKHTVNLDLCHPDPDLTMDKATFKGMDEINQNIDVIRDLFSGMSKKRLSFDVFIAAMLEEDDVEFLNQMDIGKGYQNPLRQVFSRVDKDRDALISQQEVEELSEQDWTFIQEYLKRFDDTVNFLIQQHDEFEDEDAEENEGEWEDEEENEQEWDEEEEGGEYWKEEL